MVTPIMVRPTILLIIIVTIFCGCGREPLVDCEKGLCGQKWALELDSAVARSEARVQTQPNDVNALLGLADAYIQKASFMKDQTDTRGDFWLSSNLKKIDRLLDEALNLCDKVLQQKRDAARAFQLKGESFRIRMGISREGTEDVLNAYGESISNLEKAVSLAPNSSEMWYDLGRTYGSNWFGWRKANHCYEKALELDPSNAKAFAGFRWRYGNSGAAPARATVGDQLSHDPEALRLLADGGSAYDQDRYLESIRSIPNMAKAPFVLGVSYFVCEYEETRSLLYEKVVQADHHFLKDHLVVAQSYQYQRRAMTSEALKHFKIWAQDDKGLGTGFSFYWWEEREIGAKASKAYPTFPWAWIYAGREAPHDSAIVKFKRAIELDSTLALPYYLIALTFVESKDWSNAERWLDKTLQKTSSDTFVSLNAHILSALVSAATGKTSEVLREAELALQIDSAYVAYAMSQGIHDRVEWPHAWFLLDKPIGLESLRTPSERKLASLLNLWSGWSYYRRRFYAWEQKFIPLFQKAIELDPENVEAYIATASTYTDFVLRDVKGVPFVQNALRRFPRNAKLHMELGRDYLNSNMLDKAQQEFERAYQLGDYEAKVMLDQMQEWRAEQKKQ